MSHRITIDIAVTSRKSLLQVELEPLQFVKYQLNISEKSLLSDYIININLYRLRYLCLSAVTPLYPYISTVSYFS